MRYFHCFLMTVSLLLTFPVFSEETENIKKQLGEIQASLKEIRTELEDIRETIIPLTTMLASARARGATISTLSVKLDESSTDDFVLGKADAPVTIMEFFDFQCSFCARFHQTTFPLIKKAYIDSGKVRFIFRDLPLKSHPMAAVAASLASCSMHQEKYLETYEALFRRPDLVALGKFDDIIELVEGLHPRRVKSCMKSAEYQSNEGIMSMEAKKDFEEAERLGISGTPAFFIGLTKKPGEQMTGSYIRGAQPYEVFKEEIEKYLF